MPSSEPRILARDRRTGKLVLFHVLGDDQYAVETRFDVQPVVDMCRDIRNAQPSGWKGGSHLVGQVPMPFWQRLRMDAPNDPDALKWWLRNPDHAKFRTKTGRL
jgi:hypothetical protein